MNPFQLLLIVRRAKMAVPAFILGLSGLSAQTLDPWLSETTGEELSRYLYVPSGADTSKPMPVVIYLRGLSAPRVGREPDETILQDFLDQNLLVVAMDYGGHERARVPYLNRDLFNVRNDILNDSGLQDASEKKFPVPYPMDHARIFIVPEGCRLVQNIPYEGPRGMDIIYPSNPALPVGAVLQFSADNKDRMGNFSLAFTHDSILPAQASEGLAVAMASHPVYGGYGGIDFMPMSAVWVRAAVRALRAQAEHLPLNGKIATLGFSRGSGVALMAVTTQDVQEWTLYSSAGYRLVDDDYVLSGEYVTGDHSVQGAVIMSGRFTYIDLLPTDEKAGPEGLYTQSWGPIEENYEKWRDHGALDYLHEDPGIPLFLTINKDDEHAHHQMDVLRSRLDELGASYSFFEDIEEPLAHRMPLVPEILNAMNRYLKTVLMDPDPYTGPGQLEPLLQLQPDGPVRWMAPEVRMPPADYVLESSSDLKAWTRTAVIQPDADGFLSHEFSPDSGNPTFLRLLPPEPPAP